MSIFCNFWDFVENKFNESNEEPIGLGAYTSLCESQITDQVNEKMHP